MQAAIASAVQALRAHDGRRTRDQGSFGPRPPATPDARRRHGRHRQRRHEPAARARRRPGGRGDRRHRAAPAATRRSAHALGLRPTSPRDDLVRAFRGADAVVHLAWLIQPSRDRATHARVNVDGSAARVRGRRRGRRRRRSSTRRRSARTRPARRTAASTSAGRPAASDARSTRATRPTSSAILDGFERAHPDIRVVRLRPGLIFKREAASGIRRLFAGPLLPTPLLRRGLIPSCPRSTRLRFQAVHSLRRRRGLPPARSTRDVRGAFNVAAEPVLDPAELGAPARRARRCRCRARVLRARRRRCRGSCACSRRRRAGSTSRSASR